MPIVRVTRGGRVGYKWGRHGHVYFGKGARRKAELQAEAAYANGYQDDRSTRRRIWWWR